ncbi:MAG: hypothetical protein H8D43_03575 [Chloroflexi bacterium]|nr:hypothetical protein [Chloroflexota bacterium]
MISIFEVFAQMLDSAEFPPLERQLLGLVIAAESEGLDVDRLSLAWVEKWGSIPDGYNETLQSLIDTGLLVVESHTTRTVVRVDPDLLTRVIEERLHRTFAASIERIRRVRNSLVRPEVENYFGKAEVIRGFAKTEEQLLQHGGTMYDMRDIIPFVADTEDCLRLRHAGRVEDTDIETDCYRLRRRHELLTSGKLRMTMLLDQIQAEEVLTHWAGRWGRDYVASRIAKFVELIALESFVVIFSKERIDLKLQIIEGSCSALYWRSTPRGETDRLMVFYQPLMILGHLEYFWTCYFASLQSRSVREAAAEVRAWAEAHLRNL